MKKKPIPILGKIMMLLFCGLFFANLSVFAQTSNEIIVQGVVADKNNEPLMGVSIMIDGTGKGSVTDLDGKYTLTVPDRKSVLIFSYLGFETKKEMVGNRNTIDVVMTDDTQLLDEVVIEVGYGVQKKSHLTGAISKLRTDGLDDVPVSRIDQVLQGRISGVNVVNTTSEVGVASEINVRGMTSISASSQPLVVIDGFPVEDGLGIVNMNDVESIEVLKDAASAAIYGSRAANGVIMITTKSGTSGSPKYSLKTSWAVKDAYKLYPMMSTREYIEMRMAENRLTGKKLDNNEFAYTVVDADIDYQDEALRTANLYKVEFSVQGGNNKLKYMVSGSYTSDEGIMKKNNYTRMNARAKIDATLSKRVSIGVNLAPTYQDGERPAVNFVDYLNTYPWMPKVHNEMTAAMTGEPVGSFAQGRHFNNVTFTGIDPETGLERTVTTSPSTGRTNTAYSRISSISNKYKNYSLQASAYVNVILMKDLTFRSSNSANFRYDVTNYFQKANATGDGISTRARYENNLRINLASENTFNYKTIINKDHDINSILGFSAYKWDRSPVKLYGLDFPTDYIETLNAAGSIAQYDGTTMRSGTWQEEETMASFFGRIMYAYKDRYLLSASLRTDGSSKFGKDNRWGWFPSISGGWRITEESFLKDKAKWLDQLKLRASYGVTGNNSIENYANTDKLTSANYLLGTGSGSMAGGIANNSITLGNPKLRWEQTNQYNAGFDLNIFNSRVNLTFDYYYSITKSMLFTKSANPVSGYLNYWSNDGKLRSKGVEMELSTVNIKSKDLNWTTSVNFSLDRNRILDLAGPKEEHNGGTTSNLERYIARVGEKAIQYYGFKAVGVWKDQAEIDANPHHANDIPGGIRVWNANGDDVINDKDLVVLGSPLPDFSYGISNNISYKEFSLSFLIQGSQGGEIIDGNATYKTQRYWNKDYAEGRWLSSEHLGSGNPGINEGIPLILTDHLIQDASYVALRDITFGYKVPSKFLKSLGLTGVRLYSSIQNLAMLWSSEYKGINPEARQRGGIYNNPLVNGMQKGAFPIQRTFSFGIDINF